MSNIVFLSKPKAKAEFAKAMAKGNTKSKTANAPKTKQAFAAKIKAALGEAPSMASPGLLARCRAIAGGDMAGGYLLNHIALKWGHIDARWERNGQKYLALSRADWALGAGLTEWEMRQALERLRKYASHIVTIEPMGSGADKRLWVHFDEVAYHEATGEIGNALVAFAQDGAHEVLLTGKPPIVKPLKQVKKQGSAKGSKS